MEPDSWSRFFAASKRRQSALQSRYDAHFGSDEMEGGDDESRTEFACPFCCEDFDVVGLCFHIDDEHPVEAKNGVCPVCAARVGAELVAHITTEHASIFKITTEHLLPRRRRLRKGSLGSYSTHTLLRKDLHEDNLHSLLGGSIGTSNAAPDPLLSSFMFNVPVVDTSDEQPEPLAEETSAGKVSDEKLVESATPSHSDKNLEEIARRSEFVRQLVLSTMFDDDDA